MAQSGYTPIVLFHSTTTGNVPTTSNLAVGELAINNTDGKLFYNTGSAIAVLAGAGGAGVAGGSNTQVQYNSSGSLAGSANFVWDNTNSRLGLGTTSPTETLSIYRGAGNTGAIELAGNGNTLGTTSMFVGQAADGIGYVYQRANLALVFGTNNTERMRITSAGNVGIGTSDPTRNLQVYGGASGTRTDIYASNAAGNFNCGVFTDNNGFISTSNASLFYTNSAERMRIDTSGNVGIGTSSPSSILDITKSTDTKVKIKTTSATYTAGIDIMGNNATVDTNNVILYQGGSSEGYLWNRANTYFSFGTNNTERMRIASNGNIAMGTSTTGNGRFTIEGYTTSAGNADLLINRSGTASTGVGNGSCIQLQNTTSSKSFLLQGSDDVLQFLNYGTSWNERMRIDSSGNLLVGTTTSASSRVNIAYSGASLLGQNINDTDNQANSTFLQLQVQGTQVGTIKRVASTSAVVYNTTSDYRLKTVIGAVTGQGERIDALKPIDYTWNDGGSKARGFLAHEFQSVYSQSVSGEKDAVDADGKPSYQSMQASTSEVMADLIAEIQSLRKRVAQLESK